MNIFIRHKTYSDCNEYSKHKKAADYLEQMYDILNCNSKNIKLLKEFTQYSNKMDVVRYNQNLYDELQYNGWSLDLVYGKFIRCSLK